MYYKLQGEHFDTFLRRLRLAYPATIAWEASMPPETLAEVHEYWFSQTRLRGISTNQLLELYHQVTGGAIVELGRYRPDALFQYICRRCAAHPMYLDWCAHGRRGRCPTLIDGEEEREGAARVAEQYVRRYPGRIKKPAPEVDPQSTPEYWEKKFADAPRLALDQNEMREMDQPHREEVEKAKEIIGFDRQRDA